MSRLETISVGKGRPLSPGPVRDFALRTTPAAFSRQLFDDLGQPDWMIAGTSLEGCEHWPEWIPASDYLTIVGNTAIHGPDPAFHITYQRAGVPLYYGAIDVVMRFAPRLRDALELVAKYSTDRPGYIRLETFETGDHFGLEVIPMVDLGDAVHLVVESPLLVFAGLVPRYTAQLAPETVMTLAYAAPRHADRLADALEGAIRYEADRNAIILSRAVADAPNVVYDSTLWQMAVARCEDELRRRSEADGISDFEAAFDHFLTSEGRVPQLRELAQVMGLSTRTLMRILDGRGWTYSKYRAVRVKELANVLLRDPDLSLEEVAARLGYTESSGFFRRFRQWYGQTPGQFRRELQSGA